MKKVLIVEDEPLWQRMWAVRLDGKVDIIRAYTIETAEEKFADNSDLALIVMDACVPGSFPTTISLTSQLRETFKGPMIAASSDEGYREQLMDAGCDHHATKGEVVSKVLSLLGIE